MVDVLPEGGRIVGQWLRVLAMTSMAARALGAQGADTAGRGLVPIAGRVATESGIGIPRVEVTALDASVSATTDALGQFRLLVPLRSGTMLRARRMGFAVVTRSVRLADTGALNVELPMVSLPQLLDTVQVMERSGFANERMWRAYAARAKFRQSEPHSFVTREELAGYGTQSLSRVLAHLNGRFLTHDEDTRFAEKKYRLGEPLQMQIATTMNELVRDSSGTRICVIENGVRNTGATTLDDYQTSRIEAVELYPPGSRLPSDLGTLASTKERGCQGIVVVWTR